MSTQVPRKPRREEETILRKPRGDAVLRNLPPARQEALWKYVEGEGEQAGHNYDDTIKWLAAQGINCCEATITHWRKFHLIRRRFEDCRETGKANLVARNPHGPEPTPEEIQREGNRLFAKDALKRKDDETWARIQKLELRKEALRYVKAKVKLEMRKYEDQQAKTKAAGNEPKLTPEEKQQRIREILGTE